MEWLNNLGATTYQLKWFTILYVLTIAPCWVTLFFAIWSIIKRKIGLFIFWSILLIILLALPYVFVLASMKNVPAPLWVALILLLSLIYYKTFFQNNTLSVKWFWDWYAKNYDTLLFFNPYVDLLNDITLEIIDKNKTKIEILEIGCGTGNLAQLLSSEKNISYLGIDSSKVMLLKAKNKLKNNKQFNFEYIDLDKKKLPTAQEFDVIVVNNVFYAIEEHTNIIDEMSKIVKQEGIVIVSEPLRNSSILFLLKQYLKKGGMSAYIRTLLHFGSFILVFIANLMITEIEHIKKKNFFSFEELMNSLNNHGFKVIKNKYVYENQNLLLVATPN